MSARSDFDNSILTGRESERLKNHENQETWQEFFETDWRLIHGVALQAATEAQDSVQETVIVLSKKSGTTARTRVVQELVADYATADYGPVHRLDVVPLP
jgi:hypothetical protein